MTAAVLEPPKVAWPDDGAIMLVVTDAVRYNASLESLCRVLLGRFQEGVVVTANRPYASLRSTLNAAGLDASRLRFVDCVTSLTGLAPPADPQAQFVESPTLLEKVVLRTEQMLKRLGHSKFLVVDSLSTLAVYNGNEAVAELTHNLVTRLRIQRTAAAFVVMTQPGSTALVDAVRPLCDGPMSL